VKYRNANDIFPDELLEEIRKYSSGELIYIPEASPTKKGWGERERERKSLKGREKKGIERNVYKKGCAS